MAKDTSLFIWDREIKGVKGLVVTFKDGSKDTFTKEQLSYMITKSMNDATAEREQLNKTIVPEIMKIIEAYNIKRCDMSIVVKAMQTSYNFALDVAVWKCFWTYSATKHPDQYRDNIRVSDIARVAGE